MDASGVGWWAAELSIYDEQERYLLLRVPSSTQRLSWALAQLQYLDESEFGQVPTDMERGIFKMRGEAGGDAAMDEMDRACNDGLKRLQETIRKLRTTLEPQEELELRAHAAQRTNLVDDEDDIN